MKKLFAVLFFCALLVAASVAMAGVVIVAGSPLTVDNTTTTNSIAYALTYSPSLQQYTVQHGALANTNDLLLKFYVNVTSNIVNAVQVGTWHPSNTNAATEIVSPSAFTFTPYAFTSVTTTNSQDVYISYGQ
jgi:hypothetical protein